jgi:hypothetical protein
MRYHQPKSNDNIDHIVRGLFRTLEEKQWTKVNPLRKPLFPSVALFLTTLALGSYIIGVCLYPGESHL